LDLLKFKKRLEMKIFLPMKNITEAEEKHHKIWNKLDEEGLLSALNAYTYVDADSQIYIIVEDKTNFIKELFNL